MSERDYAFEALAEVTSTDWTTGRGELNAALKSIQAQTTEIEDNYLLSCEIHDRAKLYRQVMGEGILLTPSALAKHWQRVVEQAPKPAYPHVALRGEGTALSPGACETCNGHKMIWVTDESVAPCPDCNSQANTDFWRADGSRFVALRIQP
jgi:hypothetical protein